MKRFDYTPGHIAGVNKPCSKCGKLRPLSEFYKDGSKATGLYRIRSECKCCSRLRYRNKPELRRMIRQRHRLRRYFGLTIDEYNAMHTAQAGICAICGEKETAVSGKVRTVRRLAVDHNHVTGEVRDLLCARCNTWLGVLELHPELVEKMTAYLQKWGCLSA